MPEKLVSLLGVFVLLGCAWGLSLDRKRFPVRVVLWGLGLQLTFAVIILKTTFGTKFFEFAQKAVTKLNECAMEGAVLVFGTIADQKFLEAQWGPGKAFILAISISAMIILVSALSALFYHWGILQRVVRAMAIVMQRTMGTTGSESLAAAANIFMGQTEAPLVIKPYLKGMTRSELLALMVGGMATIAGGVMAVYVALGASSGHLLTASVMSAPAALLVAKIMLPETQPSETALNAPLVKEKTAHNSIDALCRGATDGLFLSLNVLAMLIAFVAVVALANYLFSKFLGIFGITLTLQQAIGYLNHRRVRQRVALPRENLQHRVLPFRMPPVRLQRQPEWREPIPLRVRERRAQLRQETEPGRVQRLTHPHDQSGRELRPVFVQPARAFQFSLEQRAIERMLMVPRAQRRNCLDHLQPAQVRRVAHRWTPIAAPQRNVQQVRMRPQQPHRGLAVILVNRLLQ